LALPQPNPYRNQVLRLLVQWKITIELTPEFNSEERQFIMTLSQAYLQWKQETEQRGRQDGG
jgi:hypothetical protein